MSQKFNDVVRELESSVISKKRMGWIGVDLDGTLAISGCWKGLDHIGEPVPTMVERVKAWLNSGYTVKIFTARASAPGFDVGVIHNWLNTNGLPKLEVTNIKDFTMIECWDDRAVQVIPNTGRRADGLDDTL